MNLFRLKVFNQFKTFPAITLKHYANVNKYPSLSQISSIAPDTFSKKRLSHPAYSFCTRKQPEDFQESDELKDKSESRFKNFHDFLFFYLENKQDYNLQEKGSAFLEVDNFINKKLKYKQYQILTSQMKQILQQLTEQINQVTLFGLALGPQTIAKKNIFSIIQTCCNSQFISIIYRNKILLPLARNQSISKVLLQNYQIFNLKDRSTVIKFFSFYHLNNSEYLEQVKNKIIQSEKMIDFKTQSCNDIINYFYDSLMFTKKYFYKIPVFSMQTMQNYAQKIMSQKHQISLKSMNKFTNSLLKYPNIIPINKQDLIDYYYLNEKMLNHNISRIDLIDFLIFMRFVTSRINVKLDIQLKNVIIKYLKFYIQHLKLKNQRSINFDHNMLIILLGIQHYKPEVLKFFDDSLFKNIHTVDYATIEVNISLRNKIYKGVNNDQNTRQIFLKYNLTYKNFIQQLFAHLHNENLFKPHEIINLIFQINRRGQIKSKVILKILKDVKRIIQNQGNDQDGRLIRYIQKLMGEF